MSRPDRVWEMTYAADRRKANHRCRACGKVAQPGDQVLMGRPGAWVGGTKTRVLHLACADTLATAPSMKPMTWRDQMAVWCQPTPEAAAELAQQLEGR